MTIKLKDNDDLEANQLYLAREQYKTTINFLDPYFHDVFVDRHIEDIGLLTKDSDGGSIFVSENFLYELPPKKENFIFVHDFVKTAFNEMDSYYNRGLATGKLNKKSSNYMSLTPLKGYTGIHKNYSVYLTNFRNILLSDIKARKLDKKILTFKAFVDFFMQFLTQEKGIYFTRTAFIKSKLSDPFADGLTIALGQSEFSNDLKKYQNYTLDPNFVFFLESCRRFSFLINKNAPWIIHFDLYSPKGREYMKNVKINSIEELKEKRYYKALYSDIQVLKDFLEHAYSIFTIDAEAVDFVTSIDRCGNPVVERAFKQKNIKQAITGLPDIYWLKKYLQIRLIEEDIYLEQNTFETYMTDIKNVLLYGTRHNDPNKFHSALKRIQLILKKEAAILDLKKQKTF